VSASIIVLLPEHTVRRIVVGLGTSGDVCRIEVTMYLPLLARPAQRFEKRDLYLPNAIPPAVKKAE
jgi:hypothetical protein